MRSAGRSDFVRVLPWVICLALGAAAHLVWAIEAWWGPTDVATPPPRVVVHVSPPPAAAPVTTTLLVREPRFPVRRTASPAAWDPALVRMLIERHVRCDARSTCTIDPRLVAYLLAERRHTTGRRTPGRLGVRPRAFATSASP